MSSTDSDQLPLWLTDPESCKPDICPTEESVYGYAPNRGANIFFAAFFIAFVLLHAFRGFRHRTWTFLVAMVIGGLMEGIGHAGRLLLSENPFSLNGLKIQLVLLTIAPAFLAGGIYLCLKHIVLTFGESLSRLPAKWYTYIFVGCDIVSLLLQGAGGGIAAAAPEGDMDMLNIGNNTMLGGLIFQVITLAIFAVLALEFWGRVWWDARKNGGAKLNPATVELRNSRGFICFIASLVVAYLAIQIRCVYRIVEMAGGWGNELMQDEPLFIVLESVMCAIMFSVLAIFHPGSYLPMGSKKAADAEFGTPSTVASSHVPLHDGMKENNEGSVYRS